VLLAMQPFVDETNQTAANHVEYITVILNDDYNRNSNNVFFLCGDHCDTNKRRTQDMDVPLIGCPSHMFHLAVKSYLERKVTDV